MNNLAGFIQVFGGIGMVINDFFAAISVFGSAILLLSAIFFPNASPRKLADFSYWSIAGLAMGGLFQVCLYINGNVPEKIGIFLRLSPGVVNVLFVLSFLLLMARFWVMRRRPSAPVRTRKKRSGNTVHVHVSGDVSGNLVIGDENDINKPSLPPRR
jgi:hypothetical protein